MKKILVLALTLLVLSSEAFAQSASIVDTATLAVTASETVVGRTTTLRLGFGITLNRRPQTDCKLSLFAVISDIGVPDSETKRYKVFSKILKKRSSKVINISYAGAAIDGDIGDQKQGTFQAIVTCGLEDPVYSSIAAANLTCDGGLTVSKFIRALKSRIR